MAKSKQDSSYLLVCTFSQKIWKNVPIIIDNGKHTWRTEDRVSQLQLFSSNHEEADIRIALHASKSSGNVEIVAKNTNFLMLLIYSHLKSGIPKEWVLKCDTNSYSNIGTINKYLGSTVSRNIF